MTTVTDRVAPSVTKIFSRKGVAGQFRHEPGDPVLTGPRPAVRQQMIWN